MRSQVARKPASATTTRNLRKLLVDVLEQAEARGIIVGVGDRIRQARLEAGFTQDELAELIGVGMRQIQYYEAGESDPYRKLAKIAEATGKTIGWLLHGDEPTPQDRGRPEWVGEIEGRLDEILRRLSALEDSAP